MAEIEKLNICTWNCDSIKIRLIEFTQFLSNYNIDLCCLNETKLGPNQRFSVTNYTIYRNDRNTHGGGVAVLIKNNIKHHQLSSIPNVTQEHVVLKIFTSIGDFTIIAIYNPPNKHLNRNILTKLSNIDKSVLILGDLNARHVSWNCPSNNKNGNTLVDFITNNNITILTSDEPTFYPTNSLAKPSVIDVALSKNINNLTKPISLTQLNTNHNPVYLEYNTKIQIDNIKKVYDYRNMDTPAFKHYITNKIRNTSPLIENSAQLDNEVYKFIKVIKKAIKKHVPKSEPKIHNKELPNHLVKLIAYKNKLRRTSQKTRAQKDLFKYRVVQNFVNKKLFEWRNENWNVMLSKLSPHKGNLWKIKKVFTKKQNSIPPLLNNNNEIVYSDKEKSELFANYFESVHKLTENMGNKHNNNKVNKAVREFMNTRVDQNDVDLCNVEEMLMHIKNLKNKKAPGIDNIPNTIIKLLPNEAVQLFTHLTNAILRLGHFPALFKIAKLLPLPKPGKKLDSPSSYRPISLLNNFGKLIEKVVKNRMVQFMEEHNIMNKEQFGFRSHHSTTAQLTRICDFTTDNFNKNLYTGVMLFDIEKAFDTMWHNGLIYKMIQKKFPNYIIKFIISYLSNRIFTVQIKNSLSDEKIINCGVPQGSVLGPILYTLYISDITTTANTNLALYADDTAIYTCSHRLNTIKNRLTKNANRIQKHYSKWKIKLNSSKTEAILLTRRRPKIIPQIIFNNQPVPWADSVRYLGVKLDKKLNFNLHIKEVCNKANQVLCQLYPIFNKYNRLNIKNKSLIYKVCIRPILTYACPVWSNISKNNIKTLQVLQNKCLRIVGQFPRWTPIKTIHETLEIPTIDEFIKTLTEKFFEKCTFNENNLINNLGNYTLSDLKYKKYKHRRTKHILL